MSQNETEALLESMPVGEKVEWFFSLLAEKDVVAERTKALGKKIAVIEESIGTDMSLDGVEKLSTESGTVYTKEEIHPNILTNPDEGFDGWEEFCRWVAEGAKNGESRWHWIQRRISSKEFREHLEETVEMPPGLVVFTKTKLNHRRGASK